MLSLFKANSRDELITLLGFSKEEVAARVAEAVAKLKAAAVEARSKSPQDLDVAELGPREPVVSFAEPERELTPEDSDPEEDTEGAGLAAETTPSEVSTGAASDATHHADGESTTTAPSLFGDEVAGTPQLDAAADFFGSIGTSSRDEPHIQVPHHNYPLDSSVAATIGSRPSSAASGSLKNNTFRIYPSDESETDRLVTKALVLGDFESAVSLCLSSERFADAILLAVRGGPELLQRTQKAYFERRTTELPYLRLFQSIVTNDLEDIVQNADLQEWQEIFVVLCTFANQEEFSNLAEQLGQRLEFQASLAKVSSTPDAAQRAQEFRNNATLTYLAAGRLERLVNIWIEQLAEEEAVLLEQKDSLHGSRYTAHALSLQTFIEKVTVFRSAIKYADSDLTQTSSETEDARSYKLSALYDRYFEYADLLATQGLVKEAVAYLKLTPAGYHGSPGSHLDFTEGRKRLQVAAGASVAPVNNSAIPGPAALPKPAPIAPSTSNYTAYGGQYGAPVQQQQHFPPQPPAQGAAGSGYAPYGGGPYGGGPSNPYGGAPASTGAPVQRSYPAPPPAGYNSGPYGQPPMQNNQQPPNSFAPPPRGPTPSAPPLAPPPKGSAIRRDNGGWNDAPAHVAARRTPVNVNPAKPSAITSPFPNSPTPGILPPPTPPAHGQPPQALPPPPRPGSVQQRPPPPPMQRAPSVPQHGPGPYPSHPSGPPGPNNMPPPPARMMSPPQGMPRGPPPPGPYGAPPTRGHLPQQTPPMGGSQLPPGPPPRATPSPGFAQGGPPPAQQGPYAPPPQQAGFAPPPPQGQFGHMPPPQGGAKPSPPPSASPPQSIAPPPGPGQAAPSAPPPRAKAGPPPPKYRKSSALIRRFTWTKYFHHSTW